VPKGAQQEITAYFKVLTRSTSVFMLVAGLLVLLLPPLLLPLLLLPLLLLLLPLLLLLCTFVQVCGTLLVVYLMTMTIAIGQLVTPQQTALWCTWPHQPGSSS
jgi:hypothetical protein